MNTIVNSAFISGPLILICYLFIAFLIHLMVGV
jgi:hypothetical protein